MKEIKDIVQAFDEAVQLGKKAALATVVHVSGSSYRRPGARMLVTEDGKLTGAISGGCLEGDALRKAVLAITQDRKKLVIYDTTDEDDARLGIQLGCNGIVSILFEPVDAEHAGPINILRSAAAQRKPAVIVTGYSPDNKTHLGTIDPFSGEAAEQPLILEKAEQVMHSGKTLHCNLPLADSIQELFVEYCSPAIALVVVGAGNDAIPLVQMADLLGWEVTLVDGRATHANPQRFATVQRLLVGKPGVVFPELQFDYRTAIVLMTHNYNYDTELLGLLKAQDIPYIGLLGPAAKRDRMLQELSEKGIHFTDAQRSCIYGPTGLDLGAETAAEIALSVCSEIMAVLQERNPMHLKQKSEPIHSQA